MISVTVRRSIACVLAAALVSLGGLQAAFAVEDPPRENSIVLFSQGRSAVDPNSREGSRQEALRDFLVQALIQAAARKLSPSELETRYSTLSESVFSHPERYVLSYRISSEGIEEGNVYRIAGQVSVAGDLLESDLAPRGSGTPETLSDPPGVASGGAPAAQSPQEGPAGNAPQRDSGSPRKALKRVFWAVAELWGEVWHVPRSAVDPEATFSAFVSQEVEDFGWSILFPAPDFPRPDDKGSMASQAVLAAARGKGASHAVVGRLGFQEAPGGGERLVAELSVLDVSSGQRVGDFEQEVSVGVDMAEEKAMELAALTVPQLDRMLGHTASGGESPRGGEINDASLADLPKGEGLLLKMRSRQAQADWEEVEGIIRRKAGSIQVLALRFGRDGGVVQLEGVDKGALMALNGFELQGSASLRVEDPSPDGNTVLLTIIRSESKQTNP